MSLYLNLDEDELARQPFPAMPPPSGRAVSHVWSYFTKNQPTIQIFFYALVKFVKVKE